jgi:dTDP-glucose pyrophosphorylase
LFWWATESVVRAIAVREIVFVVLAEHVDHFGIDATIRSYYPSARVLVLPAPTAGAAETAAVGVAALETKGPFALNDCDHAFLASGLPQCVEQLHQAGAGLLLGFRSDSPAYSYVRFDGDGRVQGTVEKQVVSEFAIAGCYLFSDAGTFTDGLTAYRVSCPYDELFVSGVFNAILRRGGEILFNELAKHLSFGTPEEHRGIKREDLSFLVTREP